MAEPRARARRAGSSFTPADLYDLLTAYGANGPHLPSTITTLDEILTDFLIETCHAAALSASYSRRQKIKVEDFKFVLRRDELLLGQVMDKWWREKKVKADRKLAGMGDEEGKGAGIEALEAAAEEGGVGAKDLRGGKKRRKRKRVEGEEVGEEPERKRVVS